MAWQSTPYSIPITAAALIAAAFGGYAAVSARRRGGDPTLRWFAVVMGFASLWSLTYLGQLSAADQATKMLLNRLTVAPYFMAVAWLAFTAAYTDTTWLLDRRILGLLSVPAVAFTLAAPVDAGLGLVLVEEATSVVELRPGGPVVLEDTHGILYQATLGYSYLVILAGVALFARLILRSERLYRGQTVAILLAVAIPFLANVFHQFGVVLDPRINFTPVAFTASGVVLGVAVFRYELLDLVPVARDSVIESMRDGYVVLDDRGRVVDLNPAARDLLGLEGGVVGRQGSAVLPDSSLLEAADADSERRSQGELVLDEGDQRRYVEVDVSPLSETDRSLGRLVILRDVTGRRSIERRYQALIEHSSDVVSVLAPDGTYEYQSPSAERVLGYDPEEMVGESAFEYVHPEDRQRVAETFAENVADPTALVRTEYRFRHADGDYRVVESLGRNLLDDPNVGGIVVNSRDVTERVEREEQLAEKNERLEEFASVVSHDLRNPLSIAKGYVDPAYGQPDRYLPKIETSLDRMEAIIEDVLALARQEGEVTDPQSLDLASIADRAWNQVQTDAATLTVVENGDLAGDPDRTQQLLENLFRNSVEHGSTGNQNSVNSGDSVEHSSTSSRSKTGDSVEHGGPSVTVRVGVTERGFYVADDGEGIAESERDRVFESGYTTAAEGTGFGLAIVSRTADAHDWDVRVAQSESGGARFEFTTASSDRQVIRE